MKFGEHSLVKCCKRALPFCDGFEMAVEGIDLCACCGAVNPVLDSWLQFWLLSPHALCDSMLKEGDEAPCWVGRLCACCSVLALLLDFLFLRHCQHAAAYT
jgi:hypothetical protein